MTAIFVLIFFRMRRRLKEKKAREQQTRAASVRFAARFNREFPKCVFHAKPIRRKGVWSVGFFVPGDRLAFTMR